MASLILRRYIRSILEEKEKPDSGQFKVGDKINWGKYKNKKAKIIDVGFDDKDHVEIEIEPESKEGEKKKKTVKTGLYKVWPQE